VVDNLAHWRRQTVRMDEIQCSMPQRLREPVRAVHISWTPDEVKAKWPLIKTNDDLKGALITIQTAILTRDVTMAMAKGALASAVDDLSASGRRMRFTGMGCLGSHHATKDGRNVAATGGLTDEQIVNHRRRTASGTTRSDGSDAGIQDACHSGEHTLS